MADPLTVIGLVGNILAFVDFAQKVASRLNEFSSDLKDVPKSLRQIQAELPLIIDGIRRLKARADSGKLDDAAQAALGPVIAQCQQHTQQLSDILDDILPAPGASTWDRKVKAMRSLAKDREVEEISEALGRYIRTLTFYSGVNDGAQPLPVAVKKTFWLVPFDRNPNFVGRAAIFDQIDQRLHVPEGSQPKVALYGLGGIGKSQIALEYCFRKRRQEPTRSVFWVNAATVARFEESFQRIAKECGLTSPEGAQDDSIIAVQRWLESGLVNPWVMVIDNVDDETAFFREKCRNGKNPSQCLPHCPNGILILTSRTRDVAIDLANPAAPINVDSISREEGLDLIRKRLGPDPPEAHLLDLLSELEYIPLAITQAIAFILKRRKTVQHYLELYRMGDASKNRLLSYEFLEHGRQEQTMESVAKTWVLSFDWIREHHPKAADLMCLVSFYQHNGVPAQLLCHEDEDAFELEDSIAVLQAYSLLDVNESGTSYSTHRLIQAATRWWLAQEGQSQLEQWALRALQLVTLAFPPPVNNPMDDYWEDCQVLLPHAEALLQRTFNVNKKQSDLHKAELLIGTGRYNAWIMGDASGDVQRRFQSSFDTRLNHLGSKNVDTLESMEFVLWSFTYTHMRLTASESQKAVALGYELLELRREVLGFRHPDTIDGLSDLAGLLNKRCTCEDCSVHVKESEALQREALALSEEVNGYNHHDTNNCREHLASVFDEQGKHEEAVEMSTKAVTIFKDTLGPQHRMVLTARANLALYLVNAGRQDEAKEMYSDVLILKEKVYGADHSETLITARNLAILLAGQADYRAALGVVGHALDSIRTGWRKYPETVVSSRAFEVRKVEYELKALRFEDSDSEFPSPDQV